MVSTNIVGVKTAYSVKIIISAPGPRGDNRLRTRNDAGPDLISVVSKDDLDTSWKEIHYKNMDKKQK